jgi:hypothetical protein
MNILERVQLCYPKKVTYTIQYEQETGYILFDTNIPISEMKSFNVEKFNDLMKERNCNYKPSNFGGNLRLTII